MAGWCAHDRRFMMGDTEGEVAEIIAKHLSTQSAELDALRGEVERYRDLAAVTHKSNMANNDDVDRLRQQIEDAKATIAQLRARVAGLEEGAAKIVSAVVGSNADLAKDTGSTYRICCEAARTAHYKFVANRALLTQNEVG